MTPPAHPGTMARPPDEALAETPAPRADVAPLPVTDGTAPFGHHLGELVAITRFLARLPGFLRRPLGPGEARRILGQRLAARERDFLDLVRRTVYGRDDSPYRALLVAAGCAYEDLAALVTREGLEAALRAIAREGVYLTLDELRGRRPIVRGRIELDVDPGRFVNPLTQPHFAIRSSGSRGRVGALGISLDYVRDVAVDYGLVIDARGGRDWSHAIWGVPGGAALNQILRFAAFGAVPARWFVQIDADRARLPARYAWSARALVWAGRLAGVPLPASTYAPSEEPAPILAWLADVLRAGRVPHLFAFPSMAVRLCRAAQRAGVDLRGVQLTIGGEPVTAARVREITRAGVTLAAHYGSIETSTIGYGCLRPASAGELHLFHDLTATVQAPGLAGVSSETLLMTSLRPTAPLILINASLGDQARLGPRPCGCPLEALGWTTHLQALGSDQKLTAGGMAFLAGDLLRVLEEVLPARLGGGPLDYQLIEEETADGRARLRLLIDPRVGPLEPQRVAEVFYTAVGLGTSTDQVMSLTWQDGGLLEVERRAPEVRGGKIRHLRRPGAARSDRPAER
jgi:hypothetical protein